MIHMEKHVRCVKLFLPKSSVKMLISKQQILFLYSFVCIHVWKKDAVEDYFMVAI